MKTWIKYSAATGQILSKKVGDEPSADELSLRNLQYLEGDAVADLSYVVAGEVVDRPVMGITYPSSGTVGQVLNITGVPYGCLMTHPSGSSVVDDGVVSWSSAVPGGYRFVFELFPYITEEFYIAITS